MQQISYSVLTFLSDQAKNAANPSDRVIGIWGIVFTVVGIIISILVTWIFARKNRSEMKLEYQIAAVPLFANSSIVDVSKRALDIQYNGKKISEPYMLIVDVFNTGNVAVQNIDIVVRSKDGNKIMPGYIDQIPDGYHEKWSVGEVPGDPTATNIRLEFINPKQVVNARCYLDGKPDKGFSFECPLPNVQINESRLSTNLDNPKSKLLNSGRSWGNLILAGIILLLYVTVNLWTSQIDNLLYFLYRNYLIRTPYDSTLIPMFVFATLIAALIWNAIGLGRFDKWLLRHKKGLKITSVISIVVSLAGAICVWFRVFLYSPIEEIIIISSFIIVSLSIHGLMLIHQQ